MSSSLAFVFLSAVSGDLSDGIITELFFKFMERLVASPAIRFVYYKCYY